MDGLSSLSTPGDEEGKNIKSKYSTKKIQFILFEKQTQNLTMMKRMMKMKKEKKKKRNQNQNM